MGRDEEVARVRAAVRGTSVVTITGPPGVGKTRLLVEATGTPLEGAPARAITCALATLRPGADADAVAVEAGFASSEAAAATLAEAPALLVLDNCEHVIDGVARFVDHVVGLDPRNRVVATSREPLGVPGERVLVLEPLPVPEGLDDPATSPAVQLFLDRAHDAGASWRPTPRTLAEVASLCRRLDGLPLAIELAGARARALSPGELLALMDRRLDLLARRRGTGHDPRHVSLRAALDVSVDLLDVDDRRAFERLGVIPGRFDLELVVALFDTDDPVDAVDLLSRLVDRSLVVAEPGGDGTRYRLLEVVRDRALEGLIARGDADDVAERFVDVIAAEADAMIVEGLTAWSGELVARILRRHHHLVEAVEWCLDHDRTAARSNRLLLPMLAAVHRSRPLEVLALGRRVLRRWPDDPSPWHAEVLGVLATAAAMSGAHDEADGLGRSALAAPGGTPAARLLARRALAYAARARGDVPAALLHARDGRAAAAELGAASFERDLASLEALALDLTGDAVAAAEQLDWVVTHAAAAGDAIAEAGARLARATLSVRAGRWSEAEADVAAAHRLSEGLAHPWWEGALERYEAVLATHRLGWDGAAGVWWAAIEAAGRRSAAGETALAMRMAASVAAHDGRDDVARSLLALVPATPEVSVLPDLHRDDLRRLEADQALAAPSVDLATALHGARSLLTGSSPARGGEAADAAVAPAVATRPAALRRDGDTWSVAYGGRTATVQHLKGLVDLARLLAVPGREIHCLDLMGAGVVSAEAGPVLDERARREYQARILELQEDIELHRANADEVAEARAEAELDALVGQLSEAFGLGGRGRSTGSSNERARSAVTYRLRAAIRRISGVHPELGRHLENAVRTGTWCSYRPEREVRWDLGDGPAHDVREVLTPPG